MTSLKSLLILVGLDERDDSLFQAASWIAQGTDLARVTLAHVANRWELPPYWMGPPPQLEPRNDGQVEKQKLDAMASAARALFPAGVSVETQLLEWPLVPEVARIASAVSADLVCVGRLREPADDQLSQSAAALVREAPCTVFVVSEGVRLPFKRLLVPVDFSELSREAFEFALELGQHHPATSVEALHICSVPTGFSKAGRTYEEFASLLRQQAAEHSQAWMASVRPKGVPVDWRFETRENAATAIAATAELKDASLIIMGGHGRTLPASALLGHTADTVCRQTRRPFLCVKKKGQVVHLLRAMAELFEVQ